MVGDEKGIRILLRKTEGKGPHKRSDRRWKMAIKKVKLSLCLTN
jgi:hypothetical protein